MLDLSCFSKYVGLPFQQNGRTLAGFDCWGLCWFVLRNEFNVEAPRLGVDAFELDSMNAAVSLGQSLFKQVEHPAPGSIVHMLCQGHPTHVGLYIGNDFVLHSDPLGKGLSRIEPLTRLKPKILGYYEVPDAREDIPESIHP